MSHTTEHFLSDLVVELLRLTKEAQEKSAASGDPFEKGRQIALYEVLNLMKEQAEAFGLDADAIGLDRINEGDLLR